MGYEKKFKNYKDHMFWFFLFWDVNVMVHGGWIHTFRTQWWEWDDACVCHHVYR